MIDKKIFLMRPFVGAEELKAVKKVFDSKYLTEGPVTKEFETSFAQFVAAKHAIAVTSCMTGLELAIRVLRIKKGDEVIVPDFTHPATGDCVYQVNADVVLVDVDIESYNITPAAIEEAITKKTKCIIPVSWGGNPIDPEIYKIGKEHEIPILEDAACSAGARINGKKIGSIADITTFSFHPRKIITTGEGGMMTTNDPVLADKAVALKHFGQTRDGRFTYHGTNYKMSNIAAAIGLEQLKKLPGILDDRIKKAARYSDLLKEVKGVRPPTKKSGITHVFQSYCIYVERDGIRDRLKKDLADRGIETQIGTYALHLEPSYSNVRKSGNLMNSELLFNHLLTLPLHHELTDQDQEYVVDSIKVLLKKYGV
jgi:dTDP-4-amino-4,6-dideoxygalactose transaminase